MDPGFGVMESAIMQAGLLHTGDVYSRLPGNTVVYPSGIDGDGPVSPASLGLMSVISAILAFHVNKVSNSNPHGLTASDLGVVGGTYSIGPTGYILFPAWLAGGLMVQWGTTGVLPDSTQQSVNFFTRFPSGVFGIMATMSNNIGSNARTMQCVPVSDTNFDILANGSDATAFWVAIGN
jgi:hypothetical protein